MNAVLPKVGRGVTEKNEPELVVEALTVGMVELYESGTGMTYVVPEKTYDKVELNPDGFGTPVILLALSVEVVMFARVEVLLL